MPNPLISVDGVTREMTVDELTSYNASQSSAVSQTIKDHAQAALTASDLTVLRCVEAGVAVPASWHTYRIALRLLLTDPTQPYPVRPAFPAGT